MSADPPAEAGGFTAPSRILNTLMKQSLQGVCSRGVATERLLRSGCYVAITTKAVASEVTERVGVSNGGSPR
jgi:hypothetical protein